MKILKFKGRIPLPKPTKILGDRRKKRNHNRSQERISLQKEIIDGKN